MWTPGFEVLPHTVVANLSPQYWLARQDGGESSLQANAATDRIRQPSYTVRVRVISCPASHLGLPASRLLLWISFASMP